MAGNPVTTEWKSVLQLGQTRPLSGTRGDLTGGLTQEKRWYARHKEQLAKNKPCQDFPDKRDDSSR